MKKFLAAAATLSLATAAFGVHYDEVGDAPDGPLGAQATDGVGPLNMINGTINRGLGDHVDSYSILITDPSQFLAATSNNFGGSATSPTGANSDTRLWLWDSSGNLLLANDDINNFGGNTLGSMISDPSTFPGLSGEVVAPTAAGVSLTPGNYILSISLFSNDPDGAGGVDQALLGSDFDALHGHNAAAGPFVAWENAASTTISNYSIALRGATYKTPEPASLSLLALGAIFGLRRRSA